MVVNERPHSSLSMGEQSVAVVVVVIAVEKPGHGKSKPLLPTKSLQSHHLLFSLDEKIDNVGVDMAS